MSTRPTATQQGAADGFFLLLPQRPKPEAPAGTAGLDWDAYSGAQMLAFGRDCSDAAIAALRTEQPAPATEEEEDEGVSREQWVEQAMRVYLIAGDTEDEARECAEYQWGELDMDDLADAYDTAMSDIEGRGPAPATQQTGEVHDDLLPKIGSRVFIRHGRDECAHACTVTGYFAWGDLKGDKRLHRVFVRMVYEGTSIEQARMLCDCYPTAGAALAAAPQ